MGVVTSYVWGAVSLKVMPAPPLWGLHSGTVEGPLLSPARATTGAPTHSIERTANFAHCFVVWFRVMPAL